MTEPDSAPAKPGLSRSKSDAQESTQTDRPLLHKNASLGNGSDISSSDGESPRSAVNGGSPRGANRVLPAVQEHQSANATGSGSPRTAPPHTPTSLPTLAVKGPFGAAQKDDVNSRRSSESGADLSVSSDLQHVTSGTPSPATQREMIARIDSECTCTYALHKQWYRRWEEFVGVPRPGSAGGPGPTQPTDPPGPVEMDIHNDANNEYINEDAWKLFIKWYGISPTHQLDRKHLYFKDEKMFDVCMLSPYSGIVEHTVKKFNRFEEIGYIECQLRKIFHIAEHKKTRLWISEKAQVPRFRQLLLRFQMLNDCIHRDKVYILALEEGFTHDSWPSGEPGDPKGELSKYSDIIVGTKAEDHWTLEIENSLDVLSTSVSDSIGQMAEAFLQNGRQLIQERETTLEKARTTLAGKHEEVKSKEKFLDDKTRELAKEEERIKSEKEDLAYERQEFEQARERFRQEIETLERVHKIKDNKIKLDIGGHIHTTSIQTLRRDPDSMLAAMFSGRHELQQEPDGSYFIDRDGTFFRFILNFLRDGTLVPGTLPNKIPALREILREAKYYQLSSMVQFLDDLIDRYARAQHSQ